PWNQRGWHAGGSANDTHIGFEICEDGLTDVGYFSKVYQEAVELCAYLCQEYSLKPESIICHSEGHKLGIASNHGDVLHWFPKHGKSMDDFRADVKAKLAEGNEPRKFFRVILGSYLERSNAEAVLEKARKAGFKDVFLKYD